MKRDLLEAWAVIKVCLEADAPLPEDVKAYLLDAAWAIDDLNDQVRAGKVTPEAAADAIPKRLGLTAGFYRAWLRARREGIAANAYDHQVKHSGLKSEDVAADLARQLGVTPVTIYRARARKSRKRL